MHHFRIPLKSILIKTPINDNFHSLISQTGRRLVGMDVSRWLRKRVGLQCSDSQTLTFQ